MSLSHLRNELFEELSLPKYDSDRESLTEELIRNIKQVIEKPEKEIELSSEEKEKIHRCSSLPFTEFYTRRMAILEGIKNTLPQSHAFAQQLIEDLKNPAAVKIEKKENNASRKRKLSPTTPSSKDAKVETKSDTPPPERPCRQSSAANFSQHCAMFRPIKDSDDAKMETELDPPKSLITTNTGDEKIKAETTTDNPPKRRAVESYRDPISGKLKPTAVAVRPSLAPSPPAPLEPTKSQAAELSQGSQSSIFAPAPLSPGEQTNSNSSQHCYGGHGQTPSPRLS